MDQPAALYLRVSTEKQTVEHQRAALLQMAQQRGLRIVHVYEEVESAKKRRPVHEQMMKDARARRFKVLLVWALDRLQRSMIGAMLNVHQLDACGVALVSHQESWLDTTGPVRDLLVTIFGWVAEQERRRLIERTKAGQAPARKEGKHIGRPKKAPVLVPAAVDRVLSGANLDATAKWAGVSERTLRRALAARGAVSVAEGGPNARGLVRRWQMPAGDAAKVPPSNLPPDPTPPPAS